MQPGIRKRSDENLTDSAIESVILKLNAEKPITKKTACAILNIVYNPARLTKIIEKYNSDKEFIILRKKQLRNTPVDKVDSKYIVESYIDSHSLQSIADSVFRSISIVKRILNKYNVPLRTPSATYHNPIDLKLTTILDSYELGDLVYAARYDVPATIMGINKDGVYKIWLHKLCQYAYQPAYELGDMRIAQKELNIKIEELTKQEMDQLIFDARKNAKKRDK